MVKNKILTFSLSGVSACMMIYLVMKFFVSLMNNFVFSL